MIKFFSGLAIGALCVLGYQHFLPSSSEPVPAKDTITVQLKDQTIEVPIDTAKHDTVKK